MVASFSSSCYTRCNPEYVKGNSDRTWTMYLYDTVTEVKSYIA